jgi:hypothetical protein
VRGNREFEGQLQVPESVQKFHELVSVVHVRAAEVGPGFEHFPAMRV